jgi:site-specific recombinase XerD
MTHLRQKMLDEFQRRNYSQNTVSTYLHAVEDFCRYFHRSPDRLGPDHIRQYQAYLFRERKLQPGTIALCTAALRFSTSRRSDGRISPSTSLFPSAPRQLPVILSSDDVKRSRRLIKR